MALRAPVQELLPELMPKHPSRKKVPCIAFYSSRYWNVLLPEVRVCLHRLLPKVGRFPHSEMSGSKVVWHLPEPYRSHTTSFIALYSQGIHHTPLRSCKERCTPLYMLCVFFCVAGTKRPEPKFISLTRYTVLPEAQNACAFCAHPACVEHARIFEGWTLIDNPSP
jgi:hypothetical protein